MKLFILLMLLAVNVHADSFTWSWEAPLAREDGVPFDMATEGAGYQVMFNGVLEVDSDGNPILLPSGDNSLEKTFPPGDICIQLATQDTGGRVGRFTEAVNDDTQTACKTALAPPGEPTNLTVDITVTPGGP